MGRFHNSLGKSSPRALFPLPILLQNNSCGQEECCAGTQQSISTNSACQVSSRRAFVWLPKSKARIHRSAIWLWTLESFVTTGNCPQIVKAKEKLDCSSAQVSRAYSAMKYASIEHKWCQKSLHLPHLMSSANEMAFLAAAAEVSMFPWRALLPALYVLFSLWRPPLAVCMVDSPDVFSEDVWGNVGFQVLAAGLLARFGFAGICAAAFVTVPFC